MGFDDFDFDDPMDDLDYFEYMNRTGMYDDNEELEEEFEDDLLMAGLDPTDLELMSESERREALEEAGLDPDDYDEEDFLTIFGSRHSAGNYRPPAPYQHSNTRNMTSGSSGATSYSGTSSYSGATSYSGTSSHSGATSYSGTSSHTGATSYNGGTSYGGAASNNSISSGNRTAASYNRNTTSSYRTPKTNNTWGPLKFILLVATIYLIGYAIKLALGELVAVVFIIIVGVVLMKS